MRALSDTGRRRAVAVAGAVVLLLIITAAVLAFGRDQADDDATPAPTSTTTAALAPTTTEEEGATCDQVAPSSSDLPTAPPTDLEFEVVNRGIVPVSDTYGPADRTSSVWDCFSRSPLGAVMAAVSISSRSVIGEDLVAVGKQQLVENEGQQVYLDFARSVGPEGVAGPAGGFNQPVGFRVESYTPDQAVVSLAARTPDGALSAAALTVLWQDDTWKLQLLDDGSETAALTALAGLDDYVAWGL